MRWNGRVNVYNTWEILDTAQRLLLDILTQQRGRRVTVNIARKLGLRSFYAGHVYSIVISSLPNVMVDMKGRKWRLKYTGRRYYGRDGKKYHNIMVWERIGDESE